MGRRLHRLRTNRGRTWLVFAVTMAVALLVPLLVVTAARTIANSREGRAITIDTSSTVAQLPETPGFLLAGLDRDGVPVSLTALAVAPGGSGGAVVVVPVGIESDIPGRDRPTRLAAAWADGGLALQRQAVEGFLGVTFNDAATVDVDGLTDLLEPYAPFRFRLDEPVHDTAADGSDVLVADTGPVTADAELMARLLLARRANESELNRLARTQTMWDAVATALRTSTPVTSPAPVSSVPPAGPTDAAGYLAALARGPVQVTEIPVGPILDTARNPDGIDLLEPDIPATRLLMATVLPGSVSPANPNLRVRLLNPSGDPQLAYQAVARMAYVGANIVLVDGTKGAMPAESTIEFHSPSREAEARLYGPVLGGANVTPSDVRIDGIDATVTLGSLFRTFMAAEAARSTTTSTSTTVAETTTAPPTTARTTTTRGKKG